MPVSNIVLLVIAVGFLIFLFFDFTKRPTGIKVPVLVSSAIFLVAIAVIFADVLKTAPPNPDFNPHPHDPYATYLHLTLLIFPGFLLTFKKITFKDMGFLFQKNTLADGLFYGLLPILFIPLWYLRAFFFHQTVDIGIRVSFWYFIVAITLGPVSEEIFFRGILQAKLQAIPRLHWAIGLFSATLVYALFHLPKILFAQNSILLTTPYLPTLINHPVLSSFVSIVGFGVFFGYIYHKTKSLYWCILAHILVNFTGSMFVLR